MSDILQNLEERQKTLSFKWKDNFGKTEFL